MAARRPKEVLEAALRELVPEKGGPVEVKVEKGLSDGAIHAFEEELGAPLPEKIRELLRFAAGFSFDPEPEPVYEVRFAAGTGYEEIFPRAAEIAGDGCGNAWVVDVAPTGVWGPVFFACHDPPVIALQAPSLADFLEQVFALARMEPSALARMDEEHTGRIWAEDPDLLVPSETRASKDATLAAFAADLGDEWRIADLREFREGKGFTWAPNGPQSTVRRHAAGERLFAVEARKPRKGLLSWLFGR